MRMRISYFLFDILGRLAPAAQERGSDDGLGVWGAPDSNDLHDGRHRGIFACLYLY